MLSKTSCTDATARYSYSWKEYIVEEYVTRGNKSFTIVVADLHRSSTYETLLIHTDAKLARIPFYIFSANANGINFGYQDFNYNKYIAPYHDFLDTFYWYGAEEYFGPKEFDQLPTMIKAIPKSQWTASRVWSGGEPGNIYQYYLFITGITKTLLNEDDTSTFPIPPIHDPKMNTYSWMEYIVVEEQTAQSLTFTVPVAGIRRNSTKDKLFYPGSSYMPFYIFSTYLNNCTSFGYQVCNVDSSFSDRIHWYPVGTYEVNNLVDYSKLPSIIRSTPKHQWTVMLLSHNTAGGGNQSVYLFLKMLTPWNQCNVDVSNSSSNSTSFSSSISSSNSNSFFSSSSSSDMSNSTNPTHKPPKKKLSNGLITTIVIVCLVGLGIFGFIIWKKRTKTDDYLAFKNELEEDGYVQQ